MGIGKMLTLADKGGRGGLASADMHVRTKEGGGVWTPPVWLTKFVNSPLLGLEITGFGPLGKISKCCTPFTTSKIKTIQQFIPTSLVNGVFTIFFCLT